VAGRDAALPTANEDDFCVPGNLPMRIGLRPKTTERRNGKGQKIRSAALAADPKKRTP